MQCAVEACAVEAVSGGGKGAMRERIVPREKEKNLEREGGLSSTLKRACESGRERERESEGVPRCATDCWATASATYILRNC